MASGSIVIHGQLRIPAGIERFERYCAWVYSRHYPQRGRTSYLAGRVEIDMSPESLFTHNKVKADLFTDLNALLRKEPRGHLFTDGILYTNSQAAVATEPDAIFCLWDSLRENRVQYVSRRKRGQLLIEIQGAADWVLEVVSDTSVVKDTVKLRDLYFAAGVQEYWLVDARQSELSFQILQRERSEFGSVSTDDTGSQWSPMFQQWVRIQRSLDPLGYPNYSLQFRSE